MTDFYKKNDNLFRNKLTEHEFALTPKAWENMSALLDQHPIVAKRAVGYWWSLPFVTTAALAGVIGFGMYLTSNQRQAAASNPALAEQRTTEANLPQAPKISKQFIALAPPLPEIKQALVVEEKQNKFTLTSLSSRKTTPNQKATLQQKSLTKGGFDKKPQNTATLPVAKVPNPIVKTQKIKNTVVAMALSKNNKIQETKPKVKTTRTEVIYQYSTTPLRALQKKRQLLKQKNTIGTFGIGDELNTKKSPLKASIFGGVNGKVYGSTKDFSVMPFAGLSASYRIAKHHGIQTGIQYKSIGNLTQNSAAQADLGTTLNSNTGTIKRIDLLEIPLVYQFHPHPKCNIQTGVKGAWLMNTETSNPKLNNLSNAEMGISDFDFSLLLGIEYCFNENWSVGVQYSLGLVNLTEVASDVHEKEVQATRDRGVNPLYNNHSLNKNGELIVPVNRESSPNQSIKVPNELHNNDVQLLLKYTF